MLHGVKGLASLGVSLCKGIGLRLCGGVRSLFLGCHLSHIAHGGAIIGQALRVQQPGAQLANQGGVGGIGQQGVAGLTQGGAAVGQTLNGYDVALQCPLCLNRHLVALGPSVSVPVLS